MSSKFFPFLKVVRFVLCCLSAMAFTIFCSTAYAASSQTESRMITDYAVPLTTIGSVILVFSRDIFAWIIGKGKSDRELLQRVASVCAKVDTIKERLNSHIDAEEAQQNRFDHLRTEITNVRVDVAKQIGDLHTLIASTRKSVKRQRATKPAKD